MKKLIFALVSISALASGSASAADGASSAIQFGGNVSNVCVIGTGIAGALNVNLVDASTGYLKSGNFTLSAPGTYCNYISKVTVTSSNGGLTYQGTTPSLVASGKFISRIGYSTNVTWGDAFGGLAMTGPSSPTSYSTFSGDLTNASKSLVTTKAASATFELNISVAGLTGVVLAGDYSDNIIVSIGPAA